MTCEEARLLIGAEPAASPPALEEHLQGCASCRALREEMRTLDANIRLAMAQPPPQGRVQRRPAPWRQWALAASAVLAAILVLSVWLLRPSDSLAHEVVAHVQGEPESWFATEHVSAQGIDHALRASGVQLDINSDRIMYAQSCWFRGHYVPHLVVQTARGPATVMILRHESVRAPRKFREAGMTGVIVPAGEGSIAVLARGAVGVDDIATQMQQGVHWLSSGS
jgi:Protein of unknown function (DUF3379)